MNIESLKIKGLYGYIDKEINFNSDLTLLVGINGSGKTSMLNIINWMLKPSIADLCVTEFKNISLKFTYKQTRYTINCKHSVKSLRFSITTEKEKFNSLLVRIDKQPKDIASDEEKKELYDKYLTLNPTNREKKTWDLIMSLQNPTVIGLDRYMIAEESEGTFLSENAIRAKKRTTSKQSPLFRVKDIVNKEYRKRKNDILNLTNQLKDYLVSSSFNINVITLESLENLNSQPLNSREISNAEKLVKEYFEKIDITAFSDDEKTRLLEYFQNLKRLTSDFKKFHNDEKWNLLLNLNVNQFKKIFDLLKKFEQFQRDSTNTFDVITQFVNTINYFLKDSNKEILFKEDTSEITFNTLDRNGNTLTEFKDISNLSSGEQQILILFSYVAFNSEGGQIFIIDEPELSLHIKWQEEFLEYLEKITPKSTQIILATHSPIIASKRKEKAVVLLSYNEN